MRYPTAFSQNTFLLKKGLPFIPRAPEIPTNKLQGWWTQLQRFESSSIHHFWDTPQHFLSRTCFSLESGFLVFLELQKSLLVSFQGCWTQLQRFESSSMHCLWDTPMHFLRRTCFSLESGFLVFLELQKSLLVSFQGCWTQLQRFESSSMHCLCDTPQHFLKTYVCLESGFLLFLELQKSLLVCFQVCWTQLQRFERSSLHCLWDTPMHFRRRTCFSLESGFLSFLEL